MYPMVIAALLLLVFAVMGVWIHRGALGYQENGSFHYGRPARPREAQHGR